jgi:hypothetical protein
MCNRKARTPQLHRIIASFDRSRKRGFLPPTLVSMRFHCCQVLPHSRRALSPLHREGKGRHPATSHTAARHSATHYPSPRHEPRGADLSEGVRRGTGLSPGPQGRVVRVCQNRYGVGANAPGSIRPAGTRDGRRLLSRARFSRSLSHRPTCRPNTLRDTELDILRPSVLGGTMVARVPETAAKASGARQRPIKRGSHQEIGRRT